MNFDFERNIDSTELGFERIRKNLDLGNISDSEVLDFCLEKIKEASKQNIIRRGKNFYIFFDNNKFYLTINSKSYNLITAKRNIERANKKKKVIISGSAKFNYEYQKMAEKLSSDFKILDYPKAFSEAEIEDQYPKILKGFFRKIDKADIFLLANFDKNGVPGAIGAAAFSELSYAVIRKLNYSQNIEIFLLQKPPKDFFGKDELSLWIKNGWVKIWDEDRSF